MADDAPRIAPPPSVDDVLSALTDQSRIGQVDFTGVLATEPPVSRAARLTGQTTGQTAGQTPTPAPSRTPDSR